VYWTDTPDGHHCSRHDFPFKRGEVCHQCITDPPPDLDGIEQDEAEVSALRGRVNEYRCNARAALRKSGELYDSQEWNTAAKYEDTSIKWARLAEEQQTRLDDYTRDDRLIRREREMAGLRGSD
jgi:hypothetical protein